MDPGSPAGESPGQDDYRLLLTVIAAIALGVAATALPALIAGPFTSWSWASRLVMWLTGVAAVILEYLAVLFGARFYLRRVEVIATSSLALVFLAQAGMFAVLTMADHMLAPRWFVMFALFNFFSALEAEHARRVVRNDAPAHYGPEVVDPYVGSLRQVAILVSIVALLSLLLAVLSPDLPGLAIFIASCFALASMVAANIHQRTIRTHLTNLGLS